MPRVRKNTRAGAGTEPFWRIGLYIRLSREDDNEDESESIINQEKILRDSVEELFAPGTYAIVDVFADDGRTGTDTHRPEFRRITACIERKEINCMIVKSLARAFRNLGDQSKFLEEFIPSHGARFVSIGSPYIDTYRDPRSVSGFEVPIRGMFNEQFAAQTSEEIRKTFKMKRERGEFIGAFAPYGYAKDPNDKNSLIVDAESAEVVRDIFRWFIGGMSKRGIARQLNDMGIPNPAAYKRKKGMKYQSPTAIKSDGLWSAHSVSLILTNPVYTGDMIQGKYRIVSYKVHKQIRVPDEEWIIVPHMHEAIIDREMFEKAQALHQRDTRTASGDREVHLFAGYIRCADCKKAMHRKTSRNLVYYFCRSFADKKICTKHTIRLDKLENAVLLAVQAQIMLVETLSQEMDRISKAPVVHRQSQRLIQSLKQAETQLKRLTDVSDELHMDLKSKLITMVEYQRLKAKYTERMEQLEGNIAYLKGEMQAMADGIQADDPYLASFLKHRNIQTLNRGIIVELIDTIWVHEGGEITIDFAFADQHQRILDYIENNHTNLVLVEKGAAV